MRLWSLHPKYLDTKGLVAQWREALLAQAVLAGKTKGYRNHPQLLRFRACKNPLVVLGAYLHVIAEEGNRRDYSFDATKILQPNKRRQQIAVQRGQVAYEWAFLKRKLKVRDKGRYRELLKVQRVYVHPLFYRIAGPIELWEKR